jgi:hypothetical protein
VIWPSAIIVSFAIVAPAAWWSGLVTRNELLDVFVGTGAGRYTDLAVFVAVWAFAMTLFVTAFSYVGKARTAPPRERDG